MKTLTRSMTLLSLVGHLACACAHTPKNGVQGGESANAVALVNRYLTIVMAENNHGAGLTDILDADFAFEDPFVGRSESALKFIDNPQVRRWIDTRKSVRMQQQLVDGNRVCSVYAIEAAGTSGTSASYDVIDVVEVHGNRITKERVYFANPLKFAKDMGFATSYVKPYGL
jgi:hypothetical protein